MPSAKAPSEYLNSREVETGGVHGPGMHVTLGVVSRFKFENVFVPVQPLKLYPREIEVTLSSGETLKVIGLP